MLEFVRDDGNGAETMPPWTVVSYDEHDVTLRLHDGSFRTDRDVHFACRWTQQVYVRPNEQLPGYLLGLEPVEISP